MILKKFIFVTLIILYMSKGPYYGFIEKISSLEDKHEIFVLSKGANKKSVIELVKEVDITNLAVGDNICYYLSNQEDRKDLKVVLLFKHDKNDIYPFRNTFKTPVLKDWFYVYKGEKILDLDELPRIVMILLGISVFYGKRHELVRKALEILEITQDPSAIDAIFSMTPDKIYELLGDKVCLCKNEVLMQLEPYNREAIIEDTFIPVQIADLLVNLKLNGANLDNPHRRDLAQILALAVIHGTPHIVVREYIQAYQRK